MKWITSSLLLLLALLLFWLIGCYNRLQGLRAMALLALTQHVGAVHARNSVIGSICAALSSNLQHERASFAALEAALSRNAALAEAASLSRGSDEAMLAYSHSEQALARHLQTLRDIHAIYPELSVNPQVTEDWRNLEATTARWHFSAEKFNEAAAHFNAAIAQVPANQLARTMRWRPLQVLAIAANGAPEAGVLTAQQPRLI